MQPALAIPALMLHAHGNIAANQLASAITSSDRHCTHDKADGLVGVDTSIQWPLP